MGGQGGVPGGPAGPGGPPPDMASLLQVVPWLFQSPSLYLTNQPGGPAACTTDATEQPRACRTASEANGRWDLIISLFLPAPNLFAGGGGPFPPPPGNPPQWPVSTCWKDFAPILCCYPLVSWFSSEIALLCHCFPRPLWNILLPAHVAKYRLSFISGFKTLYLIHFEKKERSFCWNHIFVQLNLIFLSPKDLKRNTLLLSNNSW